VQPLRSGFLALGLLAWLSSLPAWALDGGRYGEVRVVTPSGDNRGYVVLFSDAAGWSSDDDRLASSLAGEGALVIGVDTRVYLTRIAPEKKTCDQLVGDVESLSRQVQREHSGAQYRFPILVGVGAGGTLAGAILEEAPPNTLSGAISFDPAVSLRSAHPLCPGAVAKPDGKGAYSYGPMRQLSGFWEVALTGDVAAPVRRQIHALKDAGTPIDLYNENGAAAVILAGLLAPRLAPPPGDHLADLPLVELPVEAADTAEAGPRLMAIVLSGDGGWRDLDKTIADRLQQQGVPVLGWDCLRYFWRVKTPAQTAADLADVIEAYSAKWHADKVALVGYSFGADVLPFAYNLLPSSVKSRIVLVSLLAFETRADWEISVSGWLGAPPSDAAIPVEPAVSQMPGGLIQCIYGKEEEDTACPPLAKQGAEVVETNGGHHFDQNYDALADRILAAFRAKAAG
jgi:type IV secretory pathway VirJ component